MIKKVKLVGLVIVIIFLISGIGSISLINSQENSNTLKTPKPSTLQFDDDISESLYQNIDYEFSTVFYDDANYDNVYTNAYLETTHLATSVENNNTISDVDNYFTEYPENDNITIATGTLVSNGTLHTKDTNSTDIDSTQGGFYNATYSFTNEPSDAGHPNGWGGLGGNEFSVIDSLGGHSKVVKIDDGTDIGWCQMINDFPDVIGDVTFEWWYRTNDDVGAAFYQYFEDDGDRLVAFSTWGGVLKFNSETLYDIAVNVWYRLKVTVDWSADTASAYIYNTAGTLLGSIINKAMDGSQTDGFDRVYFLSYTGIFITYLDAIDYSWTAGYSEGRNANAENAIIDINITIDGLNPHLSLEALQFELFSYYKTNESVNTKFYIYNSTDAGWDLLDDSIHLNFNDKEGITYQTPTLNKFINASGITLVRYLCESSSILTFQFSIDQLGVDMWTKLHLSHTRSFDLSGLWKYRWYIIGSNYYSNWTYFDVKDSIHNFEAISESEYTTRWILYSNDTTTTLDFHDDINTNAWTLTDVGSETFEVIYSESDIYLLDNYTLLDDFDYTGTYIDTSVEDGGMKGIAWDGTHFWVVGGETAEVYKYTAAGVYTGTHFDISGQDINPIGIVWDGTHFWVVGFNTAEVYKYTAAGVYTGTHFDVGAEDLASSGIAWDGTNFWITGYYFDKACKYTAAGAYTGTSFNVAGGFPDGIVWDGTYFWVVESLAQREVYKYTAAGVYTGIHFDIGTEESHAGGIGWDGTYYWVVGSEGDKMFSYYNNYEISKYYYGGGLVYMQTNTTESISLLSSTYVTNYTLSSGDYFEVDFQTNSGFQIDLILLRNNVIQDTLTLSPSGNTYFTRHTTQVIVDEDLEFDQLKISSTFEDTDYVRIYDIKTYNFIITGDSADFYLGSKSCKSIILEPYNYTLSIYEEGIKKVEEVIELTYDMLYQYIYQPVGVIESRVSIFSTTGTYLNFNEFRIKINRSLNDEYNVFWLLDMLFFVDTNTEINFTIYDKFSTYITSFVKVAYTFIDLYIEVYSLTVKNIMEEKTILLLNTTNSYELLSLESIEFILPKGDYQLDWTDELGEAFSMVVYLDKNSAYELNSSYSSVYFSPFLINGLGLNHDVVRFYINGTRRDFGFNTITSELVSLTVLDFFNQTIYSNVVNVKDLNEYNIYLNLKSLKIMSRATELVNYTLIKSGISDTGNIFPNHVVEYLVSSGNYTFNYLNHEDSSTGSIELNLNSDQTIVINSSYFDVYFSLFTYDGFGVNHDFVRFYINNARKDFGFNTLKQDTNTLKILDYFNATLFNSNINLKQFTEYNIYIEIYTMIIFNNYSHSIKIAIERNDIEFEQIIDAQFSMPYRMLPNVEYIVSIYYLNGTLLEEREVELDENNKIVPFGFYSEEVPYYPSFDNTSITIVLIILIFIGIISLPTYFAYKYNKRVQRLKFAYTLQHTIDKDLIEVASGRSSRMNKIK